jgi:hypothetical protein
MNGKSSKFVSSCEALGSAMKQNIHKIEREEKEEK